MEPLRGNVLPAASVLETVTNYARSNIEWNTIYQHILLNRQDFFVILPGRRWSIAHQTVYHGDVKRFKRFIAIFSNNEIDIRSKTADNKTLLDVADSKRSAYPEMYDYIKSLFMQDELIRKAKESDWRSVIELLEQRDELVNQKPPYSPCFLLHYVVENGTAHILEELLQKYHCVTNVLNNHDETPLQLAIKLNKHDMCFILDPKQKFSQQSPSTVLEPRIPLSSSCVTNRILNHELADSSSVVSETLGHLSPPNPLQPARLNFGNIKSDLNLNNDSNSSELNLLNLNSSVSTFPTSQQEQKATPLIKTIIKPVFSPGASSEPNKEDTTRNLKCHITGKIMLDPVIASDGQTYERAAILDWLNVYGFSPNTGKPMEARFENII